MEQELPVAIGVVVLGRSLLVGRDVGADEPELAVANVREGALDLGAALAERLHLRPGQDQAGFDALEQVVLVARLPVSAISFSPGAMPLIVATCARPGSSDGAMLDRR